LAIAAVAALAACPCSSVLAASTTDLPKALPDAIEPNLAEFTSGYFDAGTFAADSGNDAEARQAIRDLLTSSGFVTGYKRGWSDFRTRDVMYEFALVFQQPSGANRMLSQEHEDFALSSQFQGPIPIQLNESGFALKYADSNAHWVFIGFTKQNDAFELFRASENNFATDAAVAQATQLYRVAPDGTVLSSSPSHQSALVQFRTPIVVTFIAGALLISVALGIAVIVTVLPRRPQAVPVR